MRFCIRMIATGAVAVLLMPTFLLRAEQAATPMPHSRSKNRKTPKAELFLGYSYLRAVPTQSTGNRMVWLNGGSTSIAFNLNRYLGLVADFGGFNDSELRLTGAGAAPPRVADANGSVYTYLFGPRVSYRKFDRITPLPKLCLAVCTPQRSHSQIVPGLVVPCSRLRTSLP